MVVYRNSAWQARSARPNNPFAVFTPSTGASVSKTIAQPPLSRAPVPRSAVRPAPTHEIKPLSVPVAAPPLQPVRPGLRLKSVLLGLLLLLCLYALTPISWQKKLYAHWGHPVEVPADITLDDEASIQDDALGVAPVLQARLTSLFGRRWGRKHQGVDLAAPVGSAIRTVAAGTVVHSGWEQGYGQSVVVDHGQGRQTRYAHCSRLLVAAGARVKTGQTIARIGSTGHSSGPHLHFELLIHGQHKNPAHYYSFLSAPKGALIRASL